MAHKNNEQEQNKNIADVSNRGASEVAADSQFSSRLQQCPIAIVGMASIFADSINVDQYWNLIVNNASPIIDIPPSRWNIDDYYSPDKDAEDKVYCKRGGFMPEIDFDPMEFGLPPNILDVTDVSQMLALVVARDVLNDAGIGESSGYDRDKVGIILGAGGAQKLVMPLVSRLQGPVLEKVLEASGIDAEDRKIIIEKYKKAFVGWEESAFPGLLSNVIAGRIANRFDLGGTNCVVDAACAASMAAVKLAISELLEHRSEVMLTGGICCDNSPFMYMCFSKTPAFTTDEYVRPFDNDSKGILIGEGIGMLALKRLDDAERDGDRVYAIIKGIGTSSDGRFKSIYAPRPEGQAKALQRAYRDAGFGPNTCGLIEAHGTGTRAGDVAEFTGLNTVFGTHTDRKQYIALGSVKSQIGHTKTAAGAAGMIKAALALHHKILPASINVDKPNEAMDIESTPFYINTETRPWMPREDGIPRRAGISAFGFGGTNFHVVLEEYRPTAGGRYRLHALPQALMIVADGRQALVGTLNEWRGRLVVGSEQQPYAFNALVKTFALTHTPAAELARLGFIAKDASEALQQIDAAIKQFDVNPAATVWHHPMGLHYRERGLPSGGVVALFPGQGSQYLNMGRELACNFPPVLESAAAMDKQFFARTDYQLSSVSYPIPVFSDQQRQQQEDTLRLTQHAQPAIGALSAGIYQTFTDAGFKPDFVAGHSFGELTALWAAGVLDRADYLALACERGQAMAAQDDPAFDAGRMIAVVGEPQAVVAEIAGISGVSIANYNSTNQVVVAGSSDSIAAAITQLQGKGFNVIPLPVSAAFHTALVKHAQQPFATAVSNATFREPALPVYSNSTAGAYPKKIADIQKLLQNHILEPVRFKEQIENIYAAGGRVFIEFGPRNILTKFVEDILKDKPDIVTIATNASPKQSSDRQLRQAAVQMAVAGVELGEMDVYSALSLPTEIPKRSPLAMKLNGSNYISAQTRKEFEDALNDGWTVKQARSTSTVVAKPKVVEKIVEVERIVRAPGNAFATPPALDSSQALVASIERSVSQLVDHQQKLLDVHQHCMQGPKEYADTVKTVVTAQARQPELSASLERSLAMYHQLQTDTLKVHQQFLERQSEAMSALLALDGTAVEARAVSALSVERPSAPSRPQSEVFNTPAAARVSVSKPSAPALIKQISPVTEKPAPIAAPASVTPARAEVPMQQPIVAPPTMPVEATPAAVVADMLAVILKVVSQKTGYPPEMLTAEMDMEADLGIDSIKRVEILGAVQEALPSLPEMKPESLVELRTLGQIADHLQAYVGAAMPSAVQPAAPIAAAPAAAVADMLAVILKVVSQKTGYPPAMLTAEMDMEADLGIDSIKRVEILGAVQEALPSLPEMKPESLAELRTLGQIADHLRAYAGAAAPSATQPAAPVAVAPVVVVADMLAIILKVVSQKTGYPPEMLTAEMDMEADLGIDSIKRVEILGAVQEALPSLPEMKPESLVELRTLGQIADHLQAYVGAAMPSAVQPAAPVAAAAPTVVAVADMLAMILTVVSQKTGYPTEMLTAEMDMEADLGIDSIKRVEILGAVQEALPSLPEMKPESLAELRTLGQIADHLRAYLGDTTMLPAAEKGDQPSAVAVTNSIPSFMVKLVSVGSVTRIDGNMSGQKILVVDDGTDTAVALSGELVKAGANVTVIRPRWVANSSQTAVDRAVKCVELTEATEESVGGLIKSVAPLDSVIYLQPNFTTCEEGMLSQSQGSAKQGLDLAFLLAKYCGIKQSKSSRPAFVAVTRQGGTLGYAGPIAKPCVDTDLVQGGLSGLVKTLSHEWSNVFCRAIDVSPNLKGNRVAGIVLDELGDADTALVEVGYDTDALSAQGNRLTLIAETTDSFNLPAGNNIDSNSVFLVSGGAKGVTAHCMVRLAQEYRCKFILLGRSVFDGGEPEWAQNVPHEAVLNKKAMQFLQNSGETATPAKVKALVRPVFDRREIAGTLDAIARAGGQARYVAADVTRADSVAAAVAPAVREFGEITGIVHGAGILADAYIEQKTLSQSNAVYQTKVDGLVSLLACVKPQQLKHLVLFSSGAGFYGNEGQADYAMANEILNKSAYRFKALHPNTQVLSMNWGPWAGGMVTPELKRMFEQRGVAIIPLDTGAELLVREMSARDNRCPQILVGTDLSANQKENAAVKKPAAVA